MTEKDLPAIRQLVGNGSFSFTKHAYRQMLDRNISYTDVENILTSPTNQIVECQSRSYTLGKEHTDERVLIYDPNNKVDAIVIVSPLFRPTPEIRVITVERVNDTVWTRYSGKIPCLIRK